MTRKIILQHRLRQIERPFGWIPFRLLRDGYWAKLSAEAKILYCLLCIVSDRRGVSFYGDVQLQHSAGLGPQDLVCARDELVARDLIAIDTASHTVQLLSLPEKRQDLPDGRANTPHKASQVHIMPPALPSTSPQQQLQAVRQLISHLTTDKRQNESRSQTHATQK